MTDVMSTLIWRLHAATNLDVYIAPKPIGASTPCLTIQMVSDPVQDGNHSGGGALHFSRIQVGHLGVYETIRPYVTTVQNYLEGNKTDFISVISDGIYLETPNDENNDWSLVRGYYVQWKPN